MSSILSTVHANQSTITNDSEQQYDFETQVVQFPLHQLEYVEKMPEDIIEKYGVIEPDTCYSNQYFRSKYMGLGD